MCSVYRVANLFVLLVALVTLVGCSKGPSNKDASGLALSYLTGMAPGITEKDISILKSFEKEGNTIVVVQAGGMLCDMPVIKGKDSWIARGISCNGQFETKEILEKRNQLLAQLTTDAVEINKKFPTYHGNDLRFDKYEISEGSMILHATYTKYAHKDINDKILHDSKLDLKNKACSDKYTRSFIKEGIPQFVVAYDSNNNKIYKYRIDEGSCNNN